MHDRIFLRDLRVAAVIGIFDWERKFKQTLSIDLEMPTDVRAAAVEDHIDATLNYKAVAKRIIGFVAASEFQLVETLAERIAAIIRDEFGVPWCKVRVNKPGAIRGAQDVGVMIERGRPDGRVEVFVSLGSNVQPRRNLKLALARLAERFGSVSRSAVYRNPAVGFDGDDFLNLVVGFETDLSAQALGDELNRIEALAGRTRQDSRFAPRTLDMDLLLYGDQVISADGVSTPRPEIGKFAFMLRPLAELAAYRRCPMTGQTYAQMWQAFLAQHGDAAGDALRAIDLEKE